MTYSDPRGPRSYDPDMPQRLSPADDPADGMNIGMIAGGLAAIALIFGLAFYFNADGDGGANIATNKSPAGISAPATTGSGASTTGSGAAGR